MYPVTSPSNSDDVYCKVNTIKRVSKKKLEEEIFFFFENMKWRVLFFDEKKRWKWTTRKKLGQGELLSFKKKKNRTEINVNWQVGSNGGGCADLSNLILHPFYWIIKGNKMWTQYQNRRTSSAFFGRPFFPLRKGVKRKDLCRITRAKHKVFVNNQTQPRFYDLPDIQRRVGWIFVEGSRRYQLQPQKKIW